MAFFVWVGPGRPRDWCTPSGSLARAWYRSRGSLAVLGRCILSEGTTSERFQSFFGCRRVVRIGSAVGSCRRVFWALGSLRGARPQSPRTKPCGVRGDGLDIYNACFECSERFKKSCSYRRAGGRGRAGGACAHGYTCYIRTRTPAREFLIV